MAGKKKKVKQEVIEEEPCPLVVYTTYIGAVPQSLAHCKWLEQTFKTLNVKYRKVDLGKHTDKAQFVRQTSGKRSLPQVFINDLYIGGYEEFIDWNEEGNVYYVLKEMGYTDEIPRAFDKTKDQIEEEQKEYIEKNKQEFEKAREQSVKREKDLEHLQGVRRKYLFQRKQRYYESLKEEEEKKAQLEREKKQAELSGGGISLKDRIKSLGISQPAQQQPAKAIGRISSRLDDAGRRVSVLAPVQLGKAPPQQQAETLPVIENPQVEEVLEIDELPVPPQEEEIIHEVPPQEETIHEVPPPIIEEEIPIPPEEDDAPPVELIPDEEDIPIPPEEDEEEIPIPPEEEDEDIPIPPEEDEELGDIPIPPEEDEPPMPFEDELTIDEPPIPFDE